MVTFFFSSSNRARSSSLVFRLIRHFVLNNCCSCQLLNRFLVTSPRRWRPEISLPLLISWLLLFCCSSSTDSLLTNWWHNNENCTRQANDRHLNNLLLHLLFFPVIDSNFEPSVKVKNRLTDKKSKGVNFAMWKNQLTAEVHYTREHCTTGQSKRSSAKQIIRRRILHQ